MDINDILQQIIERLNTIENDIKKLKKKQNKRITIKRTKSAPVKMNSEPVKVDNEMFTVKRIKPTLEEAIKELGTSESVDDNRGARDGREEKT
jgi:hypothetical protein